MKTNKSFQKRIKLTRNGKLVTRRKGQNHYNAKDSGVQTIAKRRKDTNVIEMSNKTKSRFLINVNTN
jgi:ribosomal protein L35